MCSSDYDEKHLMINLREHLTITFTVAGTRSIDEKRTRARFPAKTLFS